MRSPSYRKVSGDRGERRRSLCGEGSTRPRCRVSVGRYGRTQPGGENWESDPFGSGMYRPAAMSSCDSRYVRANASAEAAAVDICPLTSYTAHRIDSCRAHSHVVRAIIIIIITLTIGGRSHGNDIYLIIDIAVQGPPLPAGTTQVTAPPR